MPRAFGNQRHRVERVPHQCQHADEMCIAPRVIGAVEFAQQLVDIGFAVAMGAGVARRVQAGRAVQGVHA